MSVRLSPLTTCLLLRWWCSHLIDQFLHTVARTIEDDVRYFSCMYSIQLIEQLLSRPYTRGRVLLYLSRIKVSTICLANSWCVRRNSYQVFDVRYLKTCCYFILHTWYFVIHTRYLVLCSIFYVSNYFFASFASFFILIFLCFIFLFACFNFFFIYFV